MVRRVGQAENICIVRGGKAFGLSELWIPQLLLKHIAKVLSPRRVIVEHQSQALDSSNPQMPPVLRIYSSDAVVRVVR